MQIIRSLKIVLLVLFLLFGVRAAVRAQSLTLTSVNPNSVQAGLFTLTLTGTGLTPSCVVNFTPAHGADYSIYGTATYISPTQLTVSGSAFVDYISYTFQVSVTDTTTKQASNAVTINVYPAPYYISLYPDHTPAGGSSFTLDVGSFDHVSSGITWTFNGVTTYLSGRLMSPSSQGVVIPASLLATPGTTYVQQGGSITVPFYITGNATITSLFPNTASAGDADFTLTINGMGFVFTDQAQWNGTPLQTMFVSATQLQALVPASLVSATGYAQVTAGYAYPAQFSIATVHVSGRVNLESETQPAQNVTLEFRPSYGAPYIIPILLAADGSFDVRGITPGAYKFAAKGYKWLRSVIPLTVGQTPLTGVQISLIGGDANGDNRVDSADFGILIGAFGSYASVLGSGYDIRADFDDDGSVDTNDFGLLIGDYNQQGAP